MFVAYRNPTKVGWLGWFEDEKGNAIAFVDLDLDVTFIHARDNLSCDTGLKSGEPIAPEMGMDDEIGCRVPGIMPVAEKVNDMATYTYACLLREIANQLDENFAKNVAGVLPELHQVLDGLTNASTDNDSVSPNLPSPPIVLIYNDRDGRGHLPPLGLSAKWEMSALRELSSDDWGKFVEMMYGIVAKAGTERLKDR